MIFAAVDPDDLASCVSCGLCLPHCPTYRITGNDSQSPRGRIELVAAVRGGEIPLDDGVRDSLNSCVQCMGCLPACPSSVRYDRIIAPVIEELASTSARQVMVKRFLFMPLTRPRLLRALTAIAALAQRLHLMPRRFPIPPVAVRMRRLRVPAASNNNRGEVILFRGCVMDMWYRQVHQATVDVLSRLGYNVRLSDPGMCCGALHAHAGMAEPASKLTANVGKSHSGSILIVNSAGCGAHLLRHAEGLGEIVDVMEFVSRHLDESPLNLGSRSDDVVVVHDACHLRNVQGSHLATHRVLDLFYEVRSIPDDGLCCGAGGAYAIDHAASAKHIVDRKNEAIQSVLDAEVRYISSGNPGCAGQLQAHRPQTWNALTIVHPIELIARALGSEDRHQSHHQGDADRS